MERSKNTAVAFLLGAVLVGGAVGFATDRVMMREHLSASRMRGVRQLLADRLRLNESQRAKVDSIIDERQRQTSLLLAPFREQMDSLRFAARDQIRLILDEPQQREFERLLDELNAPPKKREQD